MLWTNTAIVLSTRPFGEGKAIASVFTEDYGRYCGLVPGSGGKRRSLLQAGGLVSATWRARVPDQLGMLTLEPARGLDVRILHDRLRLAALAAACSLLDTGVPEREPNGGLYQHTLRLLDRLRDEAGDEACIAAYARWEWRLVAALGFGLSGISPAASGRVDTACVSVAKRHASHKTESAAQAVETVARQLQHSLSILEEHVFSSGWQRVPHARHRLAELIERDQRCKAFPTPELSP